MKTVKFSTIRFIGELLTEKWKATNRELSEAVEQCETIGQDAPVGLRAEVTAKRTILREEAAQIEDMIDDFYSHDWH